MSGIIGGAGSKSGVIGISVTNNPCFAVERASANQSVANDGSYTKVDFDVEVIDSHGKFASGTFTPGIVGNYFISFHVQVENNSTGTTNLVMANIRKNGADITGVDFTGANLSGANMYGAIYDDTTILNCVGHNICVN